MFISLEIRRANPFARRSNPNKPGSNDNDDPDHDNIGSLTDPALDDKASESSEQPHYPWDVPGIDVSLRSRMGRGARPLRAVKQRRRFAQ